MSISKQTEEATIAELRAQLATSEQIRAEAVTRYVDLKEAAAQLDAKRVRQNDELRRQNDELRARLNDAPNPETITFTEALKRVGLAALSISHYEGILVGWNGYPQPFMVGNYFVGRGNDQPFNARRSEKSSGGAVLFSWNVVGQASGVSSGLASAWVAVCKDENCLNPAHEMYLVAGLS